jgi:polyferredoxin
MKNLLTLRNTRRVAQVFFFSLFLFLSFVTDLRYLKGYPASLFLELDPLVAFATAITTHTVYMGLLWSLLLIVPTLLFGRIFCNWICPYGILHHVTGWLFGKGRAPERERIEANRYRKWYSWKYAILIAMIVTAICGSLQIGWLDPICLFHRSMSTAILPMINLFLPSSVYVRQYFHVGAWIIGFLLLFLVGMNVLIPRFFCRTLCPLGAFLGTLSMASLWRIDRDPAKCVDCDLCLKNCEGASDPQTQLRKSECFVCFNCLESCPTDAISFKFMPPLKREVTAPAVPGRRAFLGTLIGLGFYAFGRTSGASDSNYSKKVIRPPGSVEEKAFLDRCLKCDQCIRTCPTNVLQPALMESGLEGVWTPILNMKTGFCEVNCTLCSQVCPTGAIQRITIEEKTGTGAFASGGARSSSAPRFTITAAACRGPWKRRVSSARKSAPCRPRRFTRAKSPSPSATARPSRCAGLPWIPRCASAAAVANTNAPWPTRQPSASAPSVKRAHTNRRLLLDGGVTRAARDPEKRAP